MFPYVQLISLLCNKQWAAWIEGSQHFMIKKFPEFSLIFPWESSKNLMGNTFSSRCVIFTKATITSQSMNTTWTHGTDAPTPNWRNPFPSGSLLQIPWVFPDFWCFPQIPRVFPDWKIGNSFSRFSLISRVAGNPVDKSRLGTEGCFSTHWPCIRTQESDVCGLPEKYAVFIKHAPQHL